MAILQIPAQVNESQNFQFTITLDDERWRFAFFTNKIDNSWYWDLFDGDDEAILQGQPLAVGVDLLYPYRYLDVPEGIVFVIDTTGEGKDPQVDSFLERTHQVLYADAEEVGGFA